MNHISDHSSEYVDCVTAGPQRSDGLCVTCGLNWTDALPLHRYLCPGHFGYIQLPVPVFNPLLFSEMFSVSIRHIYTQYVLNYCVLCIIVLCKFWFFNLQSIFFKNF